MLRTLREIAESLILPGLAAVLPWTLYFRLLRALSSIDRLLARECADAARGYQATWGEAPDRQWLHRHRLLLLVDRADAFVSACRSDRWLERHLVRHGEWPAGLFFAIGFHHGTGLWAMRDMRRSGHRVSLISLRFSLQNFAGRRVPYAIARFRFHEVACAGNSPVIYTGGSIPHIRQALGEGRCVLGLIDVPHGRKTGRVRARLLGRVAYFPADMLRLAGDAGVPIAAYTTHLDWETGKRTLRVVPVPAGSIESQVEFLASLLDQAIHEQPEAWQLWSVAPAFAQGPEC